MGTPVVNVSEVFAEPSLRPFQARVLALCLAIVFIEGFDAQIAGFVGPAIAGSFHLPPTQLGLFFAAGNLGLLFGGLLVAPLADRIGRRPILLACIGLFGVCSIATAASASMAMLDGMRFLTGLGIGGAMANAIALTAEYAPQPRRHAMVALMLSGFILGSVAVGLVSARLVPAFGWSSVFLIGGIVPLLLLPVLVFALPESLRFLTVRDGAREQAKAILARLAPSLVIDAATRFVVEERAGKASVATLFHDGRARTTVLIWTIYFMSLLELFLLASWLPTHVHGLGIAVGLAILIGTMLQVGGLIGIGFGWMLDRMGAATTLCTAYLAGAASIAAIAAAGSNLFVLPLAVFGAGLGIIGGQNTLNAFAAGIYPTAMRATGIGWATAVGRAGSILGPSLAGVLLGMNMSSQHVFFLAVVPALIAASAAAALGRPTPALMRAA